MLHRRLAIFAVCSVLAAAASCRPQASGRADNEAAPVPAEPKTSAPIPLTEAKLDREQLIFGVMRALSAAALGQNDADEQKALKGREFELRLRFGCPGAGTNSSRNWSYDDKKNVLRAHVSADVAGQGVPASDLLLKDYEGVVGFTVDRMLLLSPGCPAGPFAVAVTGQPTIAVAQLFTSEDSRVQRPERTYDITKAIDPGEKPKEGLDLVIAGRLAGLSDGRAIHCAARDGPPTCVIAAKFDRVAIEDPASGQVLGEWSQW